MKMGTVVTGGRLVKILALGVVIAGSLAAQSLPGLHSGTKASAPAPASTDPLGRDTPRSSMYGFLQACHVNDFSRATRFLDLSKLTAAERAKTGTERARILGAVLDRDPHFELEQLDNTVNGKAGDTLAPDVDRLDTLQVGTQMGTQAVPLYLTRVNQNGVDVWIVSAASVDRLPQLQSLTGESPLEKRLPAPLVKTTMLGTPVWVWMALLMMVVLLFLLSRLFSALVIAIAKPMAKRYLAAVPGYRLQAFSEPVRLLLSVAVFRACMEVIAPSALFRDLILKVLVLLFVFGAASLVMRMVDLISDHWISKLDPRQRAMSYSVLPLGVRFAKICIFCLAVLAVLRQWGVDITAVLAGVGVGGLAVALAAQRTIENLFGGISVISDRPVLVGDLCQFGGQVGTVEDIGLRSTRIRTYDRTLVTVPNSQFSTMTLENFSRRDRYWFHPSIPVRRDTPADKINSAMQAVESVLRENSKVDPTAVPVRFTKITAEAYVLDVFAYVLTTEGSEFVEIQSELLLGIVRALEEIGVGIAVPFQESVYVPEPGEQKV